MKTVEYQPHLITYLDILGFQELIDTRSAGFISKVIRIVQDATRPAERITKEYEVQYQNFSDLCVIATPIKTGGKSPKSKGLLFDELLGLVHAQVELLNEGIFVRGAVTIGPLVRSYRVLYGPGLIAAYKSEQAVARNPRIIVTPETFQEFKKEPALWAHDDLESELESIDKLTSTDTYGVKFVDYLQAIEEEFDSPESEYPAFLNQHKQLIEHNLVKYCENKSVRAKYAWLRQYHNLTVRRRFGPRESRRFLVAPFRPLGQ